MAINPESQYSGKIAPATSGYPYGSARNITVPGDGTGTPWEAALVNDIFGFQQALLSSAGIVPSGGPDHVGASQYLEAIKVIRETVLGVTSVFDHGAVGDGVTDDTAAFTAAGTYAATNKLKIIAPKPIVSYLLDSDPTFSTDQRFITSPNFYSGTGEMPFHKFTAISEGVDPRLFNIGSMNFLEMEENEDTRKWAVVGWVDYKNPPDSGSIGTESDAVGVDGRGVCRAKDGRVWGLLGLAHMTEDAQDAGDYGVSQAYAQELDCNNNTGDDVSAFDTAPIVRGSAVVSGGTNQPAEALYILATKTPTNALGDNRWYCGLRVYQDAISDYFIHVDDNTGGVFARIPAGMTGYRHTWQETINHVQYQDATDKRMKTWSQTAGYGHDWIDSYGNIVFAIDDGVAAAKLKFTTNLIVDTTPTELNVSNGNIFELTTSGVTISAFSGGSTGHEFTILNASGGTITISKPSNARMASATFAMAANDSITFICDGASYFEKCRSVNAY